MHGARTTLGYKCSYPVVARETGEYHGPEYLHVVDGKGLILECGLDSRVRRSFLAFFLVLSQPLSLSLWGCASFV